MLTDGYSSYRSVNRALPREAWYEKCELRRLARPKGLTMNDPKITLKHNIDIFFQGENDSLDFGFPQIQRLYNSAFGTDYNNLVLILSIFFEIRKGCWI